MALKGFAKYLFRKGFPEVSPCAAVNACAGPDFPVELANESRRRHDGGSFCSRIQSGASRSTSRRRINAYRQLFFSSKCRSCWQIRQIARAMQEVPGLVALS
ncbi:hypothetical protein [Paraburkholderia silvatlantica]|uniref:hypothetical protein n=1 Tax=Paraburkholderia silvatlantica TaxID=321895 RepID=UPI0010623004|nr:hypothetical protein [Paraburkholderia silvatlantica]